MWAELERYKNHFLQLQLKYLQPVQINEIVQKEFRRATKKSKSWRGQVSYKTECKSDSYFEDRAQLAYGFWALPKLMKELNDSETLTQWRAINSLSEYVMNPLYCQRAIQHFDIVRRIQNIFLRIRLKFRKPKYGETKRLLIIFYYISMHLNGSRKIVAKHRILDQFYAVIAERQKYVNTTSKILPFLSQDTENCLYLIDTYKVYDKLWNIWSSDPCVARYPPDLWLHLTHILEQAPEEAVERGFFEILHLRVKGRLYEYHIWDVKCFGFLLRCSDGIRRFMAVDGIKLLYTILKEENLDSYENVIFALMQGMFSKQVLWRSREFTDLPLILTEIAKDCEKSEQQLWCLQAIREMGAMPVVKRFIKANCLNDIRDLQCKTFNCIKLRDEIVYWLQREIYHTTELRNSFCHPDEVE